MSATITFSNIFAYITGNIRMFLYDNQSLGWLMRSHIKEQIKWRMKVMEPLCYSQGECIKCGCSTPALQMANKRCLGPCYPKMMGRREWKFYKIDKNIKIEEDESLENTGS